MKMVIKVIKSIKNKRRIQIKIKIVIGSKESYHKHHSKYNRIQKRDKLSLNGAS